MIESAILAMFHRLILPYMVRNTELVQVNYLSLVFLMHIVMLQCTCCSGYGENLTLHDWLNQRIFPFEAHLTADDIYWATQLGAAEMLRFGIVGTTHMYSMGEAMGRAFADSGIKANFSVGTTCFDDRTFQQMPQYAETLKLKELFHGYDNGRLQVDFSLQC